MNYRKTFLICLAGSSYLGCAALQGATIVSNCTDSELRTAIAAGGLVTMACDGTITLTNTIVVATDTIVDASGRSVVVSGGNALRPFYVQPNVRFAITNLTVAFGRDSQGGAIYSSNGIVTCVRSVFRDNIAQATNAAQFTAASPAYGGGIFSAGGQLDLMQTIFSNNIARGWNGVTNAGPAESATEARGGAIYNQAGTINISDNSFTGNASRGGTGGSLMLMSGRSGALGSGGALYSTGGSVDISNSEFVANHAQGGASGYGFNNGGNGGDALGGAIACSNCILHVVGTLVRSNDIVSGNAGRAALAGGMTRGGGIHAGSNSLVHISDSRLIHNRLQQSLGPQSAESTAGGAFYNAGTASVARTTFATNNAAGVYADPRSGAGPVSGGAVFNAGSMVLTESLFVGNSAFGVSGTCREPCLPPNPSTNPGGQGVGGAIASIGMIYVTNSTFYSNLAQGGRGVSVGFEGPQGQGIGGALSIGNIAELVNVTLAQNSARNPSNNINGGLGSAISGTCGLRNCILGQSATGSNCSGAITDRGHNISSDGSCAFTGPGSLNNTDPLLGPLGNFGGPTLTMPLLAGSPALDTGDNNNCPSTDQRGHSRPYGSACDIGAFESSPPYTIGGKVKGFMVNASGLRLSVGGVQTTTDAQGNYRVDGFPAGPQEIVWMEPNLVVPPRLQTIMLGPDALTVNYIAYRTNHVTPELASNGAFRLVFAGAAAQTWRVQRTANLTGWTDALTNTTDADGVFRFLTPITPVPAQFRVVRP